MAQFVGFLAKTRRLGSLDFHKSKNVMLSKFKMLSTTANSSRMIDELGGTQLYSDVASCPTLGQRVPPWPECSRLARART